jgi:hypothetical protein
MIAQVIDQGKTIMSTYCKEVTKYKRGIDALLPLKE